MGTGLVPIHLLTIIVQSQVVREGYSHAVAAPVTLNLFVPGVYPNRWAASCYHDLCAQVTLLTVHQIPDVVRTFHPVVSCLLSWLFVFRSDELWIRLTDAVGNVCAHPAKLLFACLTSPVLRSL